MDLHEQLLAAVNARLEVARAATPGPWTTQGVGDFGWSVHFEGGMPRGVETEDNRQGRDDADFIAANDPATVIRHCERDLRVLERHAPITGGGGTHLWCDHCDTTEWPCDEIRDLAAAYGTEVDDA